MGQLIIQDLNVEIGNKKILNNINLKFNKGEMHLLMGPNGSGKTTLLKTIMGHRNNKKVSGKILFNGEEILNEKTENISKKGIFLIFQESPTIRGLKLLNFLFQINKRKNSLETLSQFEERLNEILKIAQFNHNILEKEVNHKLSGGEKKISELITLMISKSKFALIDELDSGLDVDYLKKISKILNHLKKEKVTMLIISHYSRILKYINPDYVHVLKNGTITQSGDSKLALKIEEKGF